MRTKPWGLAVGLSLLAAGLAHAEILRGVMAVNNSHMT
jgi:F0F1-type ATP synthase assembly protein I